MVLSRSEGALFFPNEFWKQLILHGHSLISIFLGHASELVCELQWESTHILYFCKLMKYDLKRPNKNPVSSDCFNFVTSL